MRVLAINDISCVGRCSLAATLPIISACGVECNVLPTAILSTHTGGFEGYTFHDLTNEHPNILQHWKSLGLKFDYIYSGYLGSISQIETVLQIKKERRLLWEDDLRVTDQYIKEKTVDGKEELSSVIKTMERQYTNLRLEKRKKSFSQS